MDLSSLLEEFRVEALDHVRALEEELLKLERAPSSPQPVRRMFLSVHTIKGGAAMLNLDELRDLSHAMEDVLAAVRDGDRACDRPMADLLFRGADLLRALILGGDAEPFQGAIADLGTELRTLVAPTGELSSLRPPQGAVAPPVAPTPQPAGPRRALVVDDSPLVRMIETALLEEADYEAEAVDNGSDALRKLEESPFALLVTGIETRGLSGLDLARAARASDTNRSIAIIIVTSSGAGESDESRRLGITAWLPKGRDGQKQLLDTARALRSKT